MQKVLGVKISDLDINEATKQAIKTTRERQASYICTINPEITLHAQNNPKYLRILNQSRFNTADGIGILWALKYLEKSDNRHKIYKVLYWITSLVSTPLLRKERTTGVELMKNICMKSKDRIFLLGAAKGVAIGAKKKLENENPHINIVGTHDGNADKSHDKRNTKIINESQAKILLVAFGAPKQEIWIKRNLKQLKTVKLAIGVGGSFDFISGKRKRAPKIMQKTGTEWLYRLVQEPKRIIRIFNATIVFPITVLKNNLKR